MMVKRDSIELEVLAPLVRRGVLVGGGIRSLGWMAGRAELIIHLVAN